VGRYDDNNPFNSIVSAWEGVIEQCIRVKKEAFQDDADEAMRFFNGPYNWQWDKRYTKNVEDPEAKSLDPTFKMTVNKTSEVVQIFGPTLYDKNPNRKVTPLPVTSIMEVLPPELQQDPMFTPVIQSEQTLLPRMKFQRKVQSLLMERYLNYTPNELDLKTHFRQAIDEALIKGMGILWTEVWSNPLNTQKLIGSFFDTVDNLLIDPDAETLDDAQFIIRRRLAPIWEVAEKFDIPEEELKGNLETWTSQGSRTSMEGDKYRRDAGRANDSMCYYEIYSKMGVGHLLADAGKKELKGVFDKLGKYVYLVIADGTPYPLNLSRKFLKNVTDDQEILDATSWPIPFWEDGTWPFTPVKFHDVPRCPWPQSHMKPAMGELKFLNWAYSFLASKIAITSRDFMACPKSVAEEFRNAILHGKDLELLEIEEIQGKKIEEIISFLQHPPFNGDVWKVISAIEQNFEKRIGLNELAYGISEKQIRVAADAEVRQQANSVRPQDMANKVEDAATQIARKEAIAARWLLGRADVEPILGPSAAALWESWIENSEEMRVALELDYRVEAGQARKPNKEREVQNMQTAIQTVLPVLIETGNFPSANALIQDWAKSIDIQEPERYTLQPPAPQPDPKAELIQAELQAKLTEMQSKLQADQSKMQMKLVQGQAKLGMDQQKHEQEMAQTAEQGQIDVLTALMKAMSDTEIHREKAVTDQIIKLTTEESNAKSEKAKKK